MDYNHPVLSIIKEKILLLSSDKEFNDLALEIFDFQRQGVPIYRDFIKLLPEAKQNPSHWIDIPFLPVSFFKTHKVINEAFKAQRIFRSSGTTGAERSHHYIADTNWYREVARTIFNRFYGPTSGYCVLGLLPSYLENGESSLVYMVNDFIKESNDSQSGFYLNDFEPLYVMLNRLKKDRIPTVLFGVTFALLDFIERFKLCFPELVVIETGGMKGRKKEMIRADVHDLLRKGFGVNAIHSEYGMTELLSQAYAISDGRFETPPWMKVVVRDTNDAFAHLPDQQTGGINVVDLANIYSCSFIATQDLGRRINTQQFEILGRFDHSDLRGCSLLVE